MRFGSLVSVITLSATAVAEPIGATHYEVEAVRSYWSGTRSYAHGEHLIRLGDIFQRVVLHPYAEQPFEQREIGLPQSEAVDAQDYGGGLRVLEREGTLWTPEDDSRVVLSESDLVRWYSMARAGEFLVCGGSGKRYAVLRTNHGGELKIVELEIHQTTSSAFIMEGDRYGGFYHASGGPLKSARVDSMGHVLLGPGSYGRGNRAVKGSRGLDHVFTNDEDGLQLYRIEEPAVLSHVQTLLAQPVGPMDVWHDPARNVDRVAVVGTNDSLFVFEVDSSHGPSLLFADGDLGTSMSQRLVFLESGRLYYSDGGSVVWLFEGPGLEQRKQLVLVQPDIRSFAIASNGDGWATHGGTDGAGWWLSYGTGMSAGFASPGIVIGFPYASHMAMNETHFYAGTKREGDANWGEWYYIFERGDSLALADSVSTPFRSEHDEVAFTIEREFLITANPVFDLADPGNPTLLGTLIDSEAVYLDVPEVAARGYPGSATDVLAAAWVRRGSQDTLAFYRISHESGVERLSSEPVDWGSYLTFDDQRALLYRAELGIELLIWVYDISDPAFPERIHAHVFDERGAHSRSFATIGSQNGVLHVASSNAQLGYNVRSMTTPLWFDGRRFVPAGKPLHAPVRLVRPLGHSDYLPMLHHSAALLSFEPPPLPRRKEHPRENLGWNRGAPSQPCAKNVRCGDNCRPVSKGRTAHLRELHRPAAPDLQVFSATSGEQIGLACPGETDARYPVYGTYGPDGDWDFCPETLSTGQWWHPEVGTDSYQPITRWTLDLDGSWDDASIVLVRIPHPTS